ncbi:apolipoprotein N-acyltransferase [Calidithermus chliarophilus]|uniref:apolipoprotein N-acyltransferase n=1 Tax=Calidithermus chliarophilus TaxID=52023 RepID=UPI00042558C9|nr:apolipoprotein N-acyltransferase [Calidithermus chliarophilus]
MRFVVAGLVLAFTLPPFPLGFLAPLPLAYFLFQGGFRVGFLAGLGFWALHLIWLPQSFTLNFGPWGAVPFIPLILAKAALWGLLFGLTVRRPLARVGGWLLLDYWTTLTEVKFPWGFLGYSMIDAPGRVLATLGGVFLLTLIVLLMAWAVARKQYWALAAWAFFWVMPLPSEAPQHQALLVQGNVDPLRKRMGLPDDELYLRLTRDGLAEHPQARLVVWPETAVYRFPEELEGVMGSRELVTGFSNGPSNETRLWREGEVLATHVKTRLTPFGETYPWRRALSGVYTFFFEAFFGPGSSFGDREPGGRPVALERYGAYICYESVFPAVTRDLVRQGAQVLVLGTNDAWFGPSFGAEQHFQMGRMRAVETGRWLLRVGNDGVTASVDPWGRVVNRMKQHVEGVMLAPYALREGQTPYVRLGDWVVALGALLLAFGLRTGPRMRMI